jgi:zinc and cadmium transporter
VPLGYSRSSVLSWSYSVDGHREIDLPHFDLQTCTLAGYCLLALLATLGGSLLPILSKLTHKRQQIALSFVGGLMLTMALLGLLPHAAHAIGSLQGAVAYLLAGFLTLFLLQRFLSFHHHHTDDEMEEHGTGHMQSLSGNVRWIGTTAGLSLHASVDGLAMAAGVAAMTRDQQALGLGIALAIILHKPFDGLTVATMMVADGTKRRLQWAIALAFAAITPLSALAFYFGVNPVEHSAVVGAALAFCAGTFLCIAGADLLPELQFHRHDRLKLSMALLLGVAVATAIVFGGHPMEH